MFKFFFIKIKIQIHLLEISYFILILQVKLALSEVQFIDRLILFSYSSSSLLSKSHYYWVLYYF